MMNSYAYEYEPGIGCLQFVDKLFSWKTKLTQKSQRLYMLVFFPRVYMLTSVDKFKAVPWLGPNLVQRVKQL